MGMSAAQARLLSITARLSDNELRSQTITNSKLRLSEKSSEASEEYINALDSTQLMWASYASDGTLSYQSLTANTLLTYGDLKNQYSLVNSAGQIMLSGSDIKNYEESDTLGDFLEKYGIEKVENPKYVTALDDIYGSYSSLLYDSSNPTSWVEYFNTLTQDNIADLYDIVNKDPSEVTSDDVAAFSNTVSVWKNSISNDISYYTSLDGTFGYLVNSLLTLPDVSFPNASDYYTTTGTELANLFTSASETCYNEAINNGRANCYLHVLAHLLDLSTTDVDSSGKVDSSWGSTYYTTVSDSYTIDTNGYINGSFICSAGQTADMAVVSEYICANDGQNVMAAEDDTDTTTYESADVDKLLSNYKWVWNSETEEYDKTLKTFKEKIIDLFYVVQHYGDADMKNADGNNYSYNDLLQYLTAFQTELENTLNQFKEDEYKQAVTNWQNTMKSWLNTIEVLLATYSNEITNLPDQEIPDDTDSRYQWYVNLWYRMGGGALNADGTKNSNNYKELDENLINNSEWLQFALEQGIITLEQVKYSADGSTTYPDMGTYDWQAIIYTNATDIKSQEDDIAIAKAEVKYKNTITEIETQDKKYDQDLKNLDSEHNALQTEYDSIKNVIDKNVERSFKAFS